MYEGISEPKHSPLTPQKEDSHLVLLHRERLADRCGEAVRESLEQILLRQFQLLEYIEFPSDSDG